MKVLDLSGTWRLCPVESFPGSIESVSNWHDQDVPSHWQQHPRMELHAGKVAYRKTFSLAPERLRVAIDGAFSGWDAAIVDGAEIAFMPPVSGG